jgi:hypothetical protein
VVVRWRGAAPDPSTLPGLEDVQVDGSRIIGMLSGEIAGFVRSIASPNLEDLTIEPASLEEAFLEYYASEDASPSEPTAEPSELETEPR